MNNRSTRYEVHVNGTRSGYDYFEMASAFGRKGRAIRRADVVAKTWPSALKVEVIDAHPGFSGNRVVYVAKSA